ncbi:hypothetical protein M5X00_04445 [Paenibacillus alvei]|uniref:Uncharacterized protein n=1 Tax=Paenibacillus alvei TaxID=44250 RepID=A0ABT4H7X1_PAEAL|nr:hypothetical protein [Paenibacillus alvei]EJW17554.1 hypothetical protein PAV_4c06700 [Paenibacillus alvei DSM 29]MCY9705798.1 hypothetical protein [Paenibacillus alvei]MCY9737117.1 hypothetical protein [Paenibacillus alvei]MCY9753507.1 hypothetical protein [Paenibacillus alvei]MCY9765078.1 hypothetical protein [Paenibacillus alvei]
MSVQAIKHTHGYRGDVPVADERIKKGNVVETYYSGNTVIKICDDYIVTSEEEIQKVLRNYHLAGWAIILSNQAKVT